MHHISSVTSSSSYSPVVGNGLLDVLGCKSVVERTEASCGGCFRRVLVSVHGEAIPALVLRTLRGDAKVVRVRLDLTSSSSAPSLIT